MAGSFEVSSLGLDYSNGFFAGSIGLLIVGFFINGGCSTGFCLGGSFGCSNGGWSAGIEKTTGVLFAAALSLRSLTFLSKFSLAFYFNYGSTLGFSTAFSTGFYT